MKLWEVHFGGTPSDLGNAVAVDLLDNVILTGGFRGTVNFGGDDLVSSGDWDVYVVKLAGNGAHQWSQRFGGTSRDLGESVTVDALGNVIVTGGFYDTVNFGSDDLVSSGDKDIFVATYDAAGAHLCSRSFGDIADDQGNGVAVGPAGNVMITGWFAGTVDFGGGDLVSWGSSDVFLAKYEHCESALSIPILSEWGLIIVTLMLLLAGAVLIKRKRGKFAS